jgi:hypothetical protein
VTAAVWIWVVLAADPPLLFAPLETTAVFRLRVAPAAVPARKLQYELLPPRRDRIAGNAAVEYLRAGLQLPQRPRLDPEESQRRDEMLDRWRRTPPHSLPADRVKRELRMYERALITADRAARMDRCDWQYPAPSIKDADSTDLQSAREVMSWLRLRIKVELAEGRLEDARRTLQTALQMAKHVGDGQTLIRSLVGVAITIYAMEALADFATVPDGPNLYWALATLPDPFLDTRPAALGESEMLANTFPGLVEFEKGPVSEARAWELVEGMRKDLQLMIDLDLLFGEMRGRSDSGLEAAFGTVLAFTFRDPPSEFDAMVRRFTDDFAAVARADAGRKWLRARGVKDTEKMPPLQAAYLTSWLRYRERFDDAASAMLLPTPQAFAQSRRVMDAAKLGVVEVRNDPVARTLLSFIPALQKVMDSHIRVRRQLAALRAVEALRAHLAVSGHFPQFWAEVTVVPIPDDPLTGKPFGYTLSYGKATIEAPPPAGENPHRGNNFRYELRAREP